MIGKWWNIKTKKALGRRRTYALEAKRTLRDSFRGGKLDEAERLVTEDFLLLSCSKTGSYPTVME